ncbi:MAG: winged helix-turn-helix domain-containing protein [Promethearchaeota archaeon]|jgi:DNA-binding MarR family transcriptional regulator
MAKDAKNLRDDIPSPAKIDKVIHEPARLMIMSYLYVVEEADFIFIKNQTGLTWGNLSSHISKLEDTGYVNVKKEFVGKKTRTLLKLTEEGREAFREYRRQMDEILKYGK